MHFQTGDPEVWGEVDVNIFAKDSGYDLRDTPLNIVRRAARLGKKACQARVDRKGDRHGPRKALVIDTSPKNNEDVAMLLNPFMEGMREAGARVKLYYARDLTIFPCCGNLNCTVRTPGKCMAHDDMRWLRRKIERTDVLVLASPLYFDGTTGAEGATASLKSLLKRLTPGKRASVDVPYVHTAHTAGEAVNLRKVVLVSGCGFWEINDFYPVLTHLKALCNNTFPDFAGNIAGTHSVILRGALGYGASARDVAGLAREAGRGLVLEDKTPVSSGNVADREHLTREVYRQVTGKNGKKQEGYDGKDQLE